MSLDKGPQGDYFEQASLSSLPPVSPSKPVESVATTSLDGRRSVSTERPTIISPGSLVPVLDKELSPPPVAVARFLHGGPPLQELSSASVVLPPGASATSVASSSFRAFTDEEEERLQRAYASLDESVRMDQRGPKKPVDATAETEISDPDNPLQPYLVPVGLDSLFSVDLKAATLFPDFWSGASVRVILAQWFYAPPSSSSTASTPSHQLKVYPVDPALAIALEEAYTAIRPWEASYSAELASALKVGAEAEAKLKHPVRAGGRQPVEVIFRDATSGRVYSSGLLSSVSKSFLSSKSGHGGGQLVLRGWDAVRNWKRKPVAATRAPSGVSESSALGDSDVDDSPLDTPLVRSRASSMNSPKPPTPTTAGFFSALKSKLGVAEVAQQPGDQTEDDRNATEEAMDGPRNRGEGQPGVTDVAGANPEGAVGAVDELVLVVHGIGQKLAGTYSSFDFVHAVNSLRTSCTTLSTSSNLAPLLHSKRAQFIPVRWRTDLSFDNVGDTGDTAEEGLDNRFTLSDIEIQDSVPFVRQVVSGLVLDVPFYLSQHKEKMIEAVVKDANRIYRLFCARNPSFVENGGRVSIIAHSLGSALTADILSSQPTFVKPLSQLTAEEKRTTKQFVFDTRIVIFVGSPLAFFLHLGQGQLIARRGRERTKDVAPDIALDRAGRYGCMAVDSVYNCYHQTDPVAFALNPTVDVAYSKLIKPIAIPSTNQTLLTNLTDTYNRVSAMLDISTLWSSGAAKASEVAGSLEEKALEEKEKEEKMALLQSEQPPAALKRMPSQRPGMRQEEVVQVTRAEKRFKALNPQGCVDFSLPAEGLNQYVESLSSHGSYWYDQRFATFVLTQLFSSAEDLERTGREEIGTEDC